MSMITISKSSPHEEIGPRSKLLMAFFERLNRTGITYVLMNNYEELPYVIPSDVDITVPPAFFAHLDHFCIDFAQSVDAVIVQKLWHGNQKCAFILGTREKGAWAFLQLDFFVAFSTKGAPALLTHEELSAGASVFNGFLIPKPEIELIFIVMRRLFKDDWSERHCNRIAELHARIATKAWLPKRYEWLHETIERAVDGDINAVIARRATDWGQLRKTARVQISLFGWLLNAVQQSWRIQHRLREETGLTAVIGGPDDPLDTDSRALLDMVFHRYLRLDESKLEKLSKVDQLTLFARIVLLKRRKGLVLLNVEPGQERMRRLVCLLQRFGQIDMHLAKKSLTKAQVVDAIARRQAEKTAEAIGRGGTQTSG